MMTRFDPFFHALADMCPKIKLAASLLCFGDKGVDRHSAAEQSKARGRGDKKLTDTDHQPALPARTDAPSADVGRQKADTRKVGDAGKVGEAGAVDEAVAPAVPTRPHWSIEVFRSLAECAPRWVSLEKSARTGPYQTHAWTKTWCQTIGQCEAIEPLIVIAKAADQDALLLPLGLTKKAGFTLCCFLGGTDSNASLPLVHRDLAPRLTKEDAATLLDLIQVAVPQIDLFAFYNQPLMGPGFANPFAQLASQPAPSNSYKMTLSLPLEPFLKTRRSASSLKKLRRKEKAAEKDFGALHVAHLSGSSPTFDAFFEAFLAQRRARFRQFGAEDPYQSTAGRDFLKKLAHLTDEAGRPVFEFHALYGGDTLIASHGVLRSGAHGSVCVNSMIAGSAAKFSPGAQLLMRQIEPLVASGITFFDFGVGETTLKKEWCDVDPLVDSLIPTSFKGRLFCIAKARYLAFKHRVKQNAKLFAALRKLRAGARALLKI